MVLLLVVLGGLIVFGLIKLLSSNAGGFGGAEKVDSISYSDIIALHYSDDVKRTLAANPALRLAARKHNVTSEGKAMTQVDVEWYDSGARRFKPMSPPWSRVAERLDEELTAKFGHGSVIFVEE